ncbi:MAG TPA: hypothetical protein VHS29_02510 [Candidatus Acidoferrales bacterium]|jgi:hypothetical protein|nr:hypothetical protein [Candidatus Acidoferrales bacterium]
MKKVFFALALSFAFSGVIQAGPNNDPITFQPNSLVVTRTVYVGIPSLLVPGVTVLPPGCVAGTVNVPLIAGGTTPVVNTCTTPTNDASFPGVFFNSAADGHFGITSPVFLDNLTTEGNLLGTLPIPTDQIVTSFSSKSELALHLSTDGKSVTFMVYRGGPGFLTGVNIFDVSNGNTPGLIDPTNTAVGQYYRSVAEVDAHGDLMITDGNAYSGDNGRGAIKGDSLYYMVGNDNSGNLSKKQVTTTIAGDELVHSTGVELLVPGQTPPVAPNITKIGDFEINQVIDPLTQAPYALDKAGKDNNYRGITIFNNTLYVTKGSGSNGINTVYQVGASGVLPSGDKAALATVPITILPGFPNTLAAGADPTTGAVTPISYPFGIWFANANTLYVCDEGDGTLVSPAVNGNVATSYAQATAGVQKWTLINGIWQMDYVINSGLNIGVPYSVDNYPTALNPATGGCRNLTGRVNGEGTVDIYAVTSTVSPSGDQGADPNKLVKVTDLLKATTLPSQSHFTTIREAKSGEVLRGVAFAPRDNGK